MADLSFDALWMGRARFGAGHGGAAFAGRDGVGAGRFSDNLGSGSEVPSTQEPDQTNTAAQRSRMRAVAYGTMLKKAGRRAASFVAELFEARCRMLAQSRAALSLRARELCAERRQAQTTMQAKVAGACYRGAETAQTSEASIHTDERRQHDARQAYVRLLLASQNPAQDRDMTPASSGCGVVKPTDGTFADAESTNEACRSSAAHSTVGHRLRLALERVARQIAACVDKSGAVAVHIGLERGVLGGAAIVISGTRAELNIDFHTDDDQSRRLLAAGSTAHELHKHLRRQGMTLLSLRVNNIPV